MGLRITQKRYVMIFSIGANTLQYASRKLELPTLASPFGDFNVTRKETREGLFGGREVPCGYASRRLELPTLVSPFGDFSVTRKETREGLFGGREEARTPDLINVSDAL
jgi:hypothetical protein